MLRPMLDAGCLKAHGPVKPNSREFSHLLATDGRGVSADKSLDLGCRDLRMVFSPLLRRSTYGNLGSDDGAVVASTAADGNRAPGLQ